MKSPQAQAQAKDSTHISRQASTIGFASITSDHLLFKTSPPNVVSLVLETIGKFDTNDDGRLSIEEVVVGMIMMANAALESAKTKNRLLWSILGLSVSTIALVFVGKSWREKEYLLSLLLANLTEILIVAAFASKDLAVSDGTLTAKGSIQPLETAVHNTHIHLGKPVGDTENEGESLAVSSMDTKLNLDVLGCMTPDDVEALKLGSFAVPATLKTENGEIHALQVHDWKENDNGVITIIDTSSIPYVIKSDPACSSVIKHGRHLQENGGFSLSWSDNVDWECVFSVNDKGVEGGACCNDGSCPGGDSLLCVAG